MRLEKKRRGGIKGTVCNCNLLLTAEDMYDIYTLRGNIKHSTFSCAATQERIKADTQFNP